LEEKDERKREEDLPRIPEDQYNYELGIMPIINTFPQRKYSNLGVG